MYNDNDIIKCTSMKSSVLLMDLHLSPAPATSPSLWTCPRPPSRTCRPPSAGTRGCSSRSPTSTPPLARSAASAPSCPLSRLCARNLSAHLHLKLTILIVHFLSCPFLIIYIRNVTKLYYVLPHFWMDVIGAPEFSNHRPDFCNPYARFCSQPSQFKLRAEK